MYYALYQDLYSTHFLSTLSFTRGFTNAGIPHDFPPGTHFTAGKFEVKKLSATEAADLKKKWEGGLTARASWT